MTIATPIQQEVVRFANNDQQAALGKMSELTGSKEFHRAALGRVQISTRAMETVLRFRQLGVKDPEAGGALLGRYISDSDDIVIDDVTTPQPGDSSSRHRFFRARMRHQQLIDIAWSKSNGVVTYLGEWHTHSEEVPTPSMIDRIGWTKKVMIDNFSEAIFFVIVGTEEVAIWEGKLRDLRVTRLTEANGVYY